jgi:hypothetical protein
VAPETEVMSATLEGQALPAGFLKTTRGGWWELTYYAPPAKGIELSLLCKTKQVITLKLFDRSYELPDLPLVRNHPRPAETIAAPYSRSDNTFVGRTISIGPKSETSTR